jgi:acyl-CoA synthetase (AMP-forming)/AMP-acid ligase II
MIVPLGHPGEICGRGYGVMVGYFRDEAATASALDADGWLHTGDIGSMDALGYCRVHSRLSDMIIRGGENIYPREVEDVLFASRMSQFLAFPIRNGVKWLQPAYNCTRTVTRPRRNSMPSVAIV